MGAEVESSGDVRVAPRVVVPAGLRAKGAVVIGDGAHVEGDVTAGGAVTLGQGARVDGTVRTGAGFALHPSASVGGLVTDGPLKLGDHVLAGSVEARHGVALRPQSGDGRGSSSSLAPVRRSDA